MTRCDFTPAEAATGSDIHTTQRTTTRPTPRRRSTRIQRAMQRAGTLHRGILVTKTRPEDSHAE